jgi:hypothetical protein
VILVGRCTALGSGYDMGKGRAVGLREGARACGDGRRWCSFSRTELRGQPPASRDSSFYLRETQCAGAGLKVWAADTFAQSVRTANGCPRTLPVVRSA